MALACYAVGILVLVSMMGCSQTAGDPTPSAYPDPLFVSDIKAKCFNMDVDVPYALIEPLTEVADKHTTRRTYNAERGTYTLDVRYFADMPVDTTHEPLPPGFQPYVPGESPLTDHPVLSHIFAQVTRDDDDWLVTLYGEMEAHGYYGSGRWELRADATLDPDTCDATLERLVAGPRKIVLYPEE